MHTSIDVILYGPLACRERAKGIVENHPLVKRVDSTDKCSQIKVFFLKPVSEVNFVAMLCSSGIHGLRILPSAAQHDAQAASNRLL